jgi:hypothetical protein
MNNITGCHDRITQGVDWTDLLNDELNTSLDCSNKTLTQYAWYIIGTGIAAPPRERHCALPNTASRIFEICFVLWYLAKCRK